MKITSRFPIILASGSTIRKEMLQNVGIPFTVCPSSVDEEAIRTSISHLPIPLQALELAKAKGFCVAEQHPDSMIIAADQICECDGEILSKPGTHANAVLQISQLQARTHHQHSAVCVIKGQECVIEHVETATLHMRNLTAEEIEHYLQEDKPYSSCGSYRLEGYGKHLFSTIDGHDDTVKGLPLVSLLDQLYLHKLISLSATD